MKGDTTCTKADAEERPHAISSSSSLGQCGRSGGPVHASTNVDAKWENDRSMATESGGSGGRQSGVGLESTVGEEHRHSGELDAASGMVGWQAAGRAAGERAGKRGSGQQTEGDGQRGGGSRGGGRDMLLTMSQMSFSEDLADLTHGSFCSQGQEDVEELEPQRERERERERARASEREQARSSHASAPLHALIHTHIGTREGGEIPEECSEECTESQRREFRLASAKSADGDQDRRRSNQMRVQRALHGAVEREEQGEGQGGGREEHKGLFGEREEDREQLASRAAAHAQLTSPASQARLARGAVSDAEAPPQLTAACARDLSLLSASPIPMTPPSPRCPRTSGLGRPREAVLEYDAEPTHKSHTLSSQHSCGPDDGEQGSPHHLHVSLPDWQEERVTGLHPVHATLAASPEAISSSMPEEDAQGWGGGVVVEEEKRGVEEELVLPHVEEEEEGLVEHIPSSVPEEDGLQCLQAPSECLLGDHAGRGGAEHNERKRGREDEGETGTRRPSVTSVLTSPVPHGRCAGECAGEEAARQQAGGGQAAVLKHVPPPPPPPPPPPQQQQQQQHTQLAQHTQSARDSPGTPRPLLRSCRKRRSESDSASAAALSVLEMPQQPQPQPQQQQQQQQEQRRRSSDLSSAAALSLPSSLFTEVSHLTSSSRGESGSTSAAAAAVAAAAAAPSQPSSLFTEVSHLSQPSHISDGASDGVSDTRGSPGGNARGLVGGERSPKNEAQYCGGWAGGGHAGGNAREVAGEEGKGAGGAGAAAG
jgi:hypothetical protein